MRAGDVRQALRDGTADTHQALDQLWSGKDLAERRHYTRFLAASAAALLPIEAELAQAGVADLLPDWPRRRRADAITADLAGLGIALDPPAPPAARPPPPSGPAAILGTLYVLEGSRLGGTLLLRQAEASTDQDIRANLRYLRHGQGDGLWRSFLPHLEAAADLDRLVESARAAFARFDTAARATFRSASHA